MALGPWVIYNSAKEFFGDNTFDLDDDAFKVGLLASTYVPSATHQTWGEITATTGNEISHGSYTAGGNTATTVTWTRVGGKVTFDISNVSWTATQGAGTLSAKYGVLYDDTTATAGDPVTDGLVCYANLSTSGTVSVSEGNTLTIQVATSGVFAVT